MSSKTFFSFNNFSRCRINVSNSGVGTRLSTCGFERRICKAIAQTDVTSQVVGADLVDPSADFARKLCLSKVACLFRSEMAEARFGSGDTDGLMEEVVSAVEAVAAESDVVVVEGLDPGIGGGMSDTLNSAMPQP